MKSFKKNSGILLIGFLLVVITIHLFYENINDIIIPSPKFNTIENVKQNDSKKYIHYFNIFHF